jgi:hypothetical protein
MRLMNFGSTLHFQPGSWSETIFEISSGILTGAGHVIYFMFKILFDRPIYFITGMQILSDQPRFLDKGEGQFKVVGVGFGRTGTVRAFSSILPAIAFKHFGN